MNQYSLSVLLAGILSLCGFHTLQADPQDLAGTWIVHNGEIGGAPIPRHIELTYSFKGNQLTMVSSNGSHYEGKFHLETDANPERLTFTLQDEIGELIFNHWVYKIEGDELLLCGESNTRPGVTTPFPKSFESKKGNDLSMLLRLKRPSRPSGR